MYGLSLKLSKFVLKLRGIEFKNVTVVVVVVFFFLGEFSLLLFAVENDKKILAWPVQTSV